MNTDPIANGVDDDELYTELYRPKNPTSLQWMEMRNNPNKILEFFVNNQGHEDGLDFSQPTGGGICKSSEQYIPNNK